MALAPDSREAGPPAGRLERLVRPLAAAGAGLAALLVLATLVVIAWSVAARYLFDAPLRWADETSGYMVVGIVMLGAADALLRGEHIAVDLLSGRLRGSARRLLDVWAAFAALAFAAALTFSAWKMTLFSLDFESYSDGYLEIAMWIPQSLVVIGGALLTLAALARLLSVLGSRKAR